MMLAAMAEAGRLSENDGEGVGASLVDPLRHPGWDSLLAEHAQSSIFHGCAWARVLRETYGHQPFYIGKFDGKRLTGLLPLMEVSSRLTGRRGVSLPFTDYCFPLHTEGGDGPSLYRAATFCGRGRQWKYLECRGLEGAWEGSSPSLSFYSHVIDLRVSLDRLRKNLDGSLRRGVRRAEESGLRVSFENGMSAMRTFFALHGGTRRRHGLPPQPWRFFHSIQRQLIETGQGFIALVSLEKQPLAAGVFFWQGRKAFYKFGASDYRCQRLRPNNLLMWSAMEHCAERGLHSLNLGRTSLSQDGLRRFKLGLGATEEKVQYGKYDFGSKQFIMDVDRVEGWFNRVFACLPMPVLRLAGAILYPHLS
jgi:CelD/BcsL family acetyltransferase involved in cellulose biosynthesis